MRVRNKKINDSAMAVSKEVNQGGLEEEVHILISFVRFLVSLLVFLKIISDHVLMFSNGPDWLT